MLQLKPVAHARACNLMLRARKLSRECGLHGQIHLGVYRKQLVWILWVGVVNKSAAYLQELVDSHLSHAAAQPEAVAAGVHFIGHADGKQVEARIERRYRGLQQQLPGERLEFVIAKAGEWPDIYDHRRLVAVAHQDLNLFAVLNAIDVRKPERP